MASEAVNPGQQAFLQTVAKALGRDRPLTVAPKRLAVGPPAFWQEQKFTADESLKLFKTNLEGLTGRVHIANSRTEVSPQIAVWLDELKIQRVIMWDHPDLKSCINIDEGKYKVTLWTEGGNSRELMAAAEQADVGITWVDYAIGYTGTLALYSTAIQGRSVSLMPATHIAIFKKSQIVPTMSTVIRNLTDRQGKSQLPCAVDFITGPSRTSDIEMDLSIGVHGPSRVWAIVIDE